jgi:hypothetical protein
MAGVCRDCSRCTETGLVSLLLAIPRLLLWFVTIFGIFQHKCPKCHHLLSVHQKMADGRFAD